MPLLLSREIGETIIIECGTETIRITLTSLSHRDATLAFKAAPHIHIYRSELNENGKVYTRRAKTGNQNNMESGRPNLPGEGNGDAGGALEDGDVQVALVGGASEASAGASDHDHNDQSGATASAACVDPHSPIGRPIPRGIVGFLARNNRRIGSSSIQRAKVPGRDDRKSTRHGG